MKKELHKAPAGEDRRFRIHKSMMMITVLPMITSNERRYVPSVIRVSKRTDYFIKAVEALGGGQIRFCHIR